MADRFPKAFFIFLGALFLLNILQSIFTQLIYDEAYYWYYSQQLDWGYFDHPPMVAFLIWLGNLLFDGELGVRFISCLLGSGTITILWLLVDNELKKKFVPHFFLLLFSMALFNAYGFLTLPDTPLLFFTSLFLLVYKKFITSSSFLISLLLGLVMAALMYSKYHAVLVIIFVLLSNPGIIKNKFAWLAVVVALLCYTPHFIWLYDHDFVSIEYHLSERPNQPYSFEGFTLGYLLNLIANFGLLFPWFYLALFKARPKDKFKRALVFLSYGIILFFFLSSFQRRTQAQWVIVICIPMALLAYEYLLSNTNSRKWMYRLSIASTVILLYARLWLVHQPLLPIEYETHGNKEWSERLEANVGSNPVIFENSYRRAPMYAFYTGNEAFSLNNIFYRRNQYSIDDSEAKMQNRKIAYVTPYANSGDFSYTILNGQEYYGWYIDDFESYRKLQCFIANGTIKLNTDKFTLQIYNPYDKSIPLSKMDLKVGYLNHYKQLKEVKPLEIDKKSNVKYLKVKDTTELRCSLVLPVDVQPEYLKFSISENGLQSAINSPSIKIKK
ncbi:ArnT family glycosyltransferase [Croceitalea rosinachiae]|uniref:Glycosyltransferase family 39 protein n=1 Tax=Croceitalea rosinachiae TaxID=3075596 RepID=A0ABU3A8Z2_9FLAO|nr:glycosyltransferase family 39 protein [Croceitalea sp. F388]MDT0606653.1 glycosyltransferase family 39 protein [Croceitalea sp. F388]